MFNPSEAQVRVEAGLEGDKACRMRRISIERLVRRVLRDRDYEELPTPVAALRPSLVPLIVQESMGPIVDRSLERLGTTDRAIVYARGALIKAIKTVQDGGDPPGVAPTYYGLRAYETVLPNGVDWYPAMKGVLLGEEEPARRASLVASGARD
jgi:hypothetical protein